MRSGDLSQSVVDDPVDLFLACVSSVCGRVLHRAEVLEDEGSPCWVVLLVQRVEQFLYAEYPVVSVPLMCPYEDADIVLGVWVLIGLLIRLHVELQRIL